MHSSNAPLRYSPQNTPLGIIDRQGPQVHTSRPPTEDALCAETHYADLFGPTEDIRTQRLRAGRQSTYAHPHAAVAEAVFDPNSMHKLPTYPDYGVYTPYSPRQQQNVAATQMQMPTISHQHHYHHSSHVIREEGPYRTRLFPDNTASHNTHSSPVIPQVTPKPKRDRRKRGGPPFTRPGEPLRAGMHRTYAPNTPIAIQQHPPVSDGNVADGSDLLPSESEAEITKEDVDLGVAEMYRALAEESRGWSY